MESENAAPSIMTIEAATRLVWDLYQRTGGATVSLFDGDLSGRELYAVSIYGDRTQVVENPAMSPSIIEAFIHANLDLLALVENTVGVWLEVAEDQTFLDVSITVPERRQAIELGRQHGEFAICYLKDLVVEYIEDV